MKILLITSALFFTNTASAYCYRFAEQGNSTNKWIMSGKGAPPAGQIDMRTSAQKQGKKAGLSLYWLGGSKNSSPCSDSVVQTASRVISYIKPSNI
jgi:hypothetical protein